jgi:hypothetical protein
MEAAGRAAAREKHLQQNLTRTSANLIGALEEVERVRVSGHAAYLLVALLCRSVSVHWPRLLFCCGQRRLSLEVGVMLSAATVGS